MKTLITGLALFLSISASAHHWKPLGLCNGNSFFESVQFSNNINVEVRIYGTNTVIKSYTVVNNQVITMSLPQVGLTPVRFQFRYKSIGSNNWSSWGDGESDSNTYVEGVMTPYASCVPLPISHIDVEGRWINDNTIKLVLRLGEVKGENTVTVHIKGKSGKQYPPVVLTLPEGTSSNTAYEIEFFYNLGQWTPTIK